MLNIELFTKIKQAITEEPSRLYMKDWLGISSKETFPNGTPIRPAYNNPLCGTSGCIAGWACILSEQGETNIEKAYKAINNHKLPIAKLGAKLLGIEHGSEKFIFFINHWRTDLRIKYEYQHYGEDAQTILTSRAKLACEVIDDFIATYNEKINEILVTEQTLEN